MKTLKTLGILVLLLALPLNGQAQFLKKLGKVVERAATRTLEKRVDKETSEKTDQALDSVFDRKDASRNDRRKGPGNTPVAAIPEVPSQSAPVIGSNFDFEPGAIPIFEDDFNKDAMGDFPAKWDTNGSGEIVTVDGLKWLRLTNGSTYLPMMQAALPEDYTIEFDLLAQGLDGRTSSHAFLKFLWTDDPGFDYGKNWSMVELSPCQFIASQGVVEKRVDGERLMRNKIDKDYRNAINGRSRISIAVNKTRMRVWLNANKIVDIPRLVPEGITHFKMETKGLRDPRDKDELFITNFRMAKSGTDKRSKLLTEGVLSTNAILFKSGSSEISSGADDVLREVAEAMQSVPGMTVLIVGHTDADGDAATNLALSQKRAETIKMALVAQHDIKYSRIQAEGKGESAPVAPNTTQDGRAQNRRVEFIKQ